MGFVKDFVWGAATSAYQIEGGVYGTGKGRHIWDVYTKEPGRVYGGHTGEIACDHYYRFREDVQIMKKIGLNAYRFSIDWSRVLPEGTGRVNEEGIRFYSDLIDELLKNGIEPYITLFHWELGRYPEEGLARYEKYLPRITGEDMRLISEPIDVYGQNIYNGKAYRMGEDGKPEEVDRMQGYAKTAVNWPVTPECLYWGPKFLYERYHKPIYITENGMACHDTVSVDGRVHDPNRIDFLSRYLHELKRAAGEIDIRGYFQWSLMDNFEWEKGYAERFGMVYVDFKTQKRILKDSAYWYRDVIRLNGAGI